jgi:hypothetical protein
VALYHVLHILRGEGQLEKFPVALGIAAETAMMSGVGLP